MSRLLTEIREYGEGLDVGVRFEDDRWIIEAANEGGHNGTAVDLMDVIKFYVENFEVITKKQNSYGERG